MIYAAADGRIQTRKTLTGQDVREPFVYLLSNVRSLVDKAGVQLDKTGARGDLLPGVIRVEDTTNPNQRNSTAR